MLGSWYGAGDHDGAVTFLEGLRAALGDRITAHAEGVPVSEDDTSGIAAAVEAARTADIVVMCLGETASMRGEAASRGRLDLPGRQAELARSEEHKSELQSLMRSSSAVFCLKK